VAISQLLTRRKCVERGDLQHAVKAGVFDAADAVEIGSSRLKRWLFYQELTK